MSDYSEGKGLRIPRLRTDALEPGDYADSTCFPAGWLAEANAGWRLKRPVIDAETCTGCLQCYLYCPDGAIRKTHTDDVAVFVDVDFCKGCGICKTVCAFGSISMVDEGEAKKADAVRAAARGEGERA